MFQFRKGYLPKRTPLKSQFTPEEIKAYRAKIIARNTFEYHFPGERIIRLHDTDIVRFTAAGKIILNSGGYRTYTTKDSRTYTTKDRMNRYLSRDYGVWLDRGKWFVYHCSASEWYRMPYYDGITLPDAFDWGDAPWMIRRFMLLNSNKVIHRFGRESVTGVVADWLPPRLMENGTKQPHMIKLVPGPTKNFWWVTAPEEHRAAVREYLQAKCGVRQKRKSKRKVRK